MKGFLRDSVSRRNFIRVFGAGATLAASNAFSASLHGQQQAGMDIESRRKGLEEMARLSKNATVFISSNENPHGPCDAALAMMTKVGPTGGRYDKQGLGKQVVDEFSKQFALKPGYVAFYPGSTGPLDMALMSHIGPDRGLVCGDPGYEQGPWAAQAMKAPLKLVPLTPTFAHDVKAMLAADPNAGAYYICNPNNPTGTMTPKEDIVWLLKNKPAGSVVIVDEAYHHFSNDESCIGLAGANQDIIILRTFSKLYGMAGIRAGFAIARPDLLAKFEGVSNSIKLRTVASVSMMASAAALASLQDFDIVKTRRRDNARVREQTVDFLTQKGIKVVPGSQANMFMVDTGRPGRDFQIAMLKEKVAIGRTWPSMPTYCRITVGTEDEMKQFQTAFVKCHDESQSAQLSELHLLDEIPTELYRC